jgi:hypothetical protein
MEAAMEEEEDIKEAMAINPSRAVGIGRNCVIRRNHAENNCWPS